MAITKNTTLLDDAAAAIGTQFDSGNFTIYDGAVPADADTALGAQNVLVDITLPATAFTDTGDGVITENAWTTGTVAQDGTATFFRVWASDDSRVIQGTVGGTGSGEDLEIGNTALQTGGDFDPSGTTITVT